MQIVVVKVSVIIPGGKGMEKRSVRVGVSNARNGGAYSSREEG